MTSMCGRGEKSVEPLTVQIIRYCEDAEGGNLFEKGANHSLT